MRLVCLFLLAAVGLLLIPAEASAFGRRCRDRGPVMTLLFGHRPAAAAPCGPCGGQPPAVSYAVPGACPGGVCRPAAAAGPVYSYPAPVGGCAGGNCPRR